LDLVEIEAWTLRIVDQVGRQVRIEDTRVELKSDWLDPKRAARRLAGHANAARGSTILWIIGLDETAGVVGITSPDFAIWWGQVQSEFNELAPSVTNLVIPVQGKEVVALAVDTSRAPLVVKNPAFGSPGGGSVNLEVPWRDGTSTRSATRSDLIRLLEPLLRLPEITVLNGRLQVAQAGTYREVRNLESFKRTGMRWSLSMDIYCNSGIGDVVVIPDHQCGADLKLFSRGQTFPLENVRVLSRESSQLTYPLPTAARLPQPQLRHTIQRGVNQVIIEGPGPAKIVASLENDDTSTVDLTDVATVSVDIKLTPVSASIPISLTTELSWFASRDERTFTGPTIAEWQYRPAQVST
jgi:hypothetical protein